MNQAPHKSGDLCKDKGVLCVLVQIGTSEDSRATKLMAEVKLLQPFGWFLDLTHPNIQFESLKFILGEDVSGCWVADLFSRNLDSVEWLKETN